MKHGTWGTTVQSINKDINEDHFKSKVEQAEISLTINSLVKESETFKEKVCM